MPKNNKSRGDLLRLLRGHPELRVLLDDDRGAPRAQLRVPVVRAQVPEISPAPSALGAIRLAHANLDHRAVVHADGDTVELSLRGGDLAHALRAAHRRDVVRRGDNLKLRHDESLLQLLRPRLDRLRERRVGGVDDSLGLEGGAEGLIPTRGLDGAVHLAADRQRGRPEPSLLIVHAGGPLVWRVDPPAEENRRLARRVREGGERLLRHVRCDGRDDAQQPGDDLVDHRLRAPPGVARG